MVLTAKLDTVARPPAFLTSSETNMRAGRALHAGEKLGCLTYRGDDADPKSVVEGHPCFGSNRHYLAYVVWP
eukprot:scaffold165757_cov48-Prasinocladus_malaysianus.AAC.2